jgi:hypothetical protein
MEMVHFEMMMIIDQPVLLSQGAVMSMRERGRERERERDKSGA